jgi:hypothetical protein
LARQRFAAQCDFRWKIWFWLFCWWPRSHRQTVRTKQNNNGRTRILHNNSLIYPLSTSSKTTLTTRCADALLTLPVHRAFGASDPARASRLRRFYPCPCIAPSALLPLPVTIAPLEIPAFLFPRTRRNALTRRFAGSAPTRISARNGRGTLVSRRRTRHPSRPPRGGCPRAPARGVRRRARQPANTAF